MGAAVPSHQPVLLRETLELLRPAPGATIVDATLGGGGHAEALCDAIGERGRVYGIDRDPHALEHATRRLSRYGERFMALRGDYRDIVRLLRAEGVFVVDCLLADLGVSSLQLDDPRRGFSFRHDGPLDMRMDPESGRSAADLLVAIAEEDLERILRSYGEEKRAARIARAIVRERERRPLRTTGQLREIIERALGPDARRYRIHPATRTFQALRIAVNDELAGLDAWVAEALTLVRPGGRMAVIAFHSLEDRVIKHAFRSLAERCICPPGLPVCGCGRRNLVKVLTPRPLRPDPSEIEANPRARSARLRAVERIR